MQERSPDRQLGRYQQVATLGQGGMGTVHLVLARGFAQFRKLLVIKELRQDLTCQKGFVRLFMDEAKLAARLAHPNVVQTFEAFQDGNRYLLAMEYLDGQALSALILRLASKGGRLPLGMHIHVLCEVLSGLHYAHELRDYDSSPLHVVHRDVSPQNVFLTYHGGVKVVDFGVAKAANAAFGNSPDLFVGKFSYAAPEQISGRPVDARTDVFAVGVMLWQAIAERRFSSGTPTPEATQARAQGAEPRIREVVPDVDPELADICDRAIEVDPDKRYSSAKAFRTALLAYLEARDVQIHDAEIGQLMLRMFASDRDELHAQIESAVEASRQSKADAMPNDEREPTTKVDLSRAPELSEERASEEHAELYATSNVMRLSTPETSANASVHKPNKRVLGAGIAGLSVLALSSLYWLDTRPEPARVAETKVLPATLVSGHEKPREAPPATRPTPTSPVPNAPVGAPAATTGLASAAASGAPASRLSAATAPAASTLPQPAASTLAQPAASTLPQPAPWMPARLAAAGPAQPSASTLAQPAASTQAQPSAALVTRQARRGRQPPHNAAPIEPAPRPGQSQPPHTAAAPVEAALRPSPTPAVQTPPSPTALEAGADLGVLRRGTRARIDVENPY